MKLSLKIKTICVVLIIAIVLAFVSIMISYNIYSNTMDNHYREMTMNLAATEAVALDKQMTKKITNEVLEIYRSVCDDNGNAPDFESFSDDEIDAYFGLYDSVIESEEYKNVRSQLEEIADANKVKSIYICYLDIETGKAVYIIDVSPKSTACRPGTCDDMVVEILELMKSGVYEFPAYITNYEEYGWLCSAASGIYGEDNELISYAYIDISMDDVMQDRENFLIRLCVILATITILLVVIILIIINHFVVAPINSLAFATGTFVSEKKSHGLENEKSAISKLSIHTGDEIEKLTVSIQKMELEINSYISNITSITAEKERIGAELNVATQIQADMLPNIFPAFPDHEEFDIYASMEPAKEVGGDFYDFFMVDDSHLAIVMADVSGKGVPAALFMVIAKTLIKNHVLNKEDPAVVFTNVNNQLCENNEVGMFVTGWMGIMDIKSGHMTYVNAGHNLPLIIRADGTVEWVKSRPGLVLAGMEGIRYRQNELQLNHGDTIYLYTDGVTEALDEKLELFGDKRLYEALSEADVKNMNPTELIDHVSKALKNFAKDAEQADDITMLALYRNIKADSSEGVWSTMCVKAERSEWDNVSASIEEQLDAANSNIKTKSQILIAAEEIFVNIASYAYIDKEGFIDIKTKMSDEGLFYIRFEDTGIPYNPLQRQDPDITLSAEERGVGGLGIYIVKKTMDKANYEYKEGKNCFTIAKSLE